MAVTAHSTQNLTFITVPTLTKTGKATRHTNTHIDAQPGGRYGVVDTQGKPINTEKSVRIGNDLVVTLQNGQEVVLKNFFPATKAARARSAASDNQDTSEDAPQWLQFENGQLVAVVDGSTDGHTSMLLEDASQFADLQFPPSDSQLLAQAELGDSVTDTVADPVTEAPTAPTITPPVEVEPLPVLETAQKASPALSLLPLIGGGAAAVAVVAVAAGGGGGGSDAPAVPEPVVPDNTGGGGDGGGGQPVNKEPPKFSSIGVARAIAENSGAGQSVYTATATAAAAAATSNVSYSLKAGTGDAPAFTIDKNTGKVTLTNNPDFETKPSYSFTVIATDAAGNASELPVTLNVINLDDTAPTFTSPAIASIPSNIVANSLVYSAVATDTDFISPNTASSVTYSLKATGAASFLTIDAKKGAVNLKGSPTFQTGANHSFTVIATDAAGNAREQVVNLVITEIDETPPIFNSEDTGTALAENSGAGQMIYKAITTDSSTVSYSLKPNVGDASDFTIDSSTGQVTLTGNPDYETKSSYSFTVIATDAANNSSEKAVTLTIANVDDMAPTFTSGTASTEHSICNLTLEVKWSIPQPPQTTDFIAPNTASERHLQPQAQCGRCQCLRHRQAARVKSVLTV